MKLNEYQEFTKSLAVYNDDIVAYIDTCPDYAHAGVLHEEPLQYLYPVLALAEEAGEVAGKVAKYIRKKDTDYQSLRVAVKAELGDVFYQLSECARQFDLTLDEVMQGNVDKLTDRKERDVIIGVGDDR